MQRTYTQTFFYKQRWCHTATREDRTHSRSHARILKEQRWISQQPDIFGDGYRTQTSTCGLFRKCSNDYWFDPSLLTSLLIFSFEEEQLLVECLKNRFSDVLGSIIFCSRPSFVTKKLEAGKGEEFNYIKERFFTVLTVCIMSSMWVKGVPRVHIGVFMLMKATGLISGYYLSWHAGVSARGFNTNTEHSRLFDFKALWIHQDFEHHHHQGL